MKFDFALSVPLISSQLSLSSSFIIVVPDALARAFSFYLQLLLPMHNTYYQVLIYIAASKRAINLTEELTDKTHNCDEAILLLKHKRCL